MSANSRQLFWKLGETRVAEHGPFTGCKSAEASLSLAKLGPKSSTFEPSWGAGFDPKWTITIGPTSNECCPNLGENGVGLDDNVTDVGRTWTEIGRLWAEFNLGLRSANFDRVRQSFTDFSNK